MRFSSRWIFLYLRLWPVGKYEYFTKSDHHASNIIDSVSGTNNIIDGVMSVLIYRR